MFTLSRMASTFIHPESKFILLRGLDPCKIPRIKVIYQLPLLLHRRHNHLDITLPMTTEPITMPTHRDFLLTPTQWTSRSTLSA